jgi:hypothetical protein
LLTVAITANGVQRGVVPLPVFDLLKRLREVCARFIDPEFGYHPNFDYAKHDSAWFAFSLMEVMSDNKITGTKDGPFRAIAGLLYEAISGQQDADLKRACDTVLRENRNITKVQIEPID